MKARFVSVLFALIWGTCRAASFVWTGAGEDANWSTPANWSGSVAPANNGTASIVLTGINQLSSVVDAPWDINSLAFGTNGGSFILSGNSLTIRAGGIFNSNINIQVISNSITLGTNQTWTAASNAVTFAGNIVLPGTNLLTISGSFNSTLSGIISGTGGFAKSGTGTNFLMAANTYSGLTTVNAGVINLQNASSALGSTNSGTTVISGAALQIQGGIAVTNESLTLNGTGVSALGALRSLTNNNTWNGPVTLAGAATIACDTNTFTLPGAVINSTNGIATNLLTFSATGNIFVAGSIGGAPGGLTKSGIGTLTLTASNSYGGLTTVSAGILTVQNISALGPTNSGTTVASGAALQLPGGLDISGEALSISGAGILNGGALRNTSGSNSWNGPITLAAAATINADAGTLYLGGFITNAANTITLTNASTTTVILAGGLGTGSGGFIKNGPGTLMLNSTNTYTGTTTLNNGLIQCSAPSVLAAASATTLNTNAVLDLNNFPQSLLSLAGSGSGSLTLGTATLTINNTAATTFAGSISGSGGLLKASGAGVWTLSGVNTFTGNTVINAGAISIKANNGLGATNGSLTLNGGTLTTSATMGSARLITLGAGGGTFNLGGDTTLTNVISGPGALTKLGSKNLILLAANTYLGATTNGGGTLTIGADNNLGDSSAPLIFSTNATLISTASFTSARNISLLAGAATFAPAAGATNTLNGIISGAGIFLENGSGGLILGGNNTFTNTLNLTKGTLRLAASERLADLAPVLIAGTSATLDLNGFSETIGSLATTAAGKVLLGNGLLTAGGNNLSTTNAAVISGNGAFTKTGAGLMIQTGANTYTNTTTIAAGTYQLGAGDRIANTSPLVISNGAVFSMVWNGTNFNETVASLAGAGSIALGTGTLTAGNTSTSANFSGSLTGAGAFNKIGTGTQIFSGTNTHSGTTTISVGTLQINGSSTNSPITIASAATLSGNGTVGTVLVNAGATNSPGTNSTGTLTTGSQTWTAGGNYNWEINNATGIKGGSSGWDFLNILGTLNITANSSSKFNLRLVSLTAANAAGSVTNFDNSTTYIWTIATATGGINGFSAASFNLITNGFQNALGAGTFALSQAGNDLNLIFTTAAAAAVNNVQSGTLTSTGAGTNSVTLGTPVNPTNSFLVFNIRHNSSVPGGSMLRARLVNSNTVEFIRATSESSAINIQWYLAEYSGGVRVQRGETSQTNTVINLPLAPVSSTNQAFVLWSKTPDPTATVFADSDPVLGELTSVSNLQFRVSTAPNAAPIIAWQVIEFLNPASIGVQRGTLTNLTGTNLVSSAALATPMDTNATFILTGYRTSGSGTSIGARMLRAQLTSTTGISFDRAIAGAPDDIAEISWQAVQLKDGSLAQSGSASFATGGAQTNLTLATSLNTNRIISFSAVQPAGGQNAGRSSSTGNILGVGAVTLAMTSSSQLTLDRNNTSAPADIGWSVVGLGPSSLLIPATGGSAISADTKGAAYTSLSGPTYTEVLSGNAGVGTINLKVPGGFIFDTNTTLPTVLITRINGSGANSLNINGVASGTPVAMTTITPTNLIFTITSASTNGVTCSLTWQNLRVRPTAGAPLTNGSLTYSGTSVVQGVLTNSSSWGFLAEVVGAANRLGFQTLPSTTAIAGADFSQQPVLQVQDQFGNGRSGDNTTVVLVTNSGAGLLNGTTNVTAVGGIAAFSGLDYEIASTIKLGFGAAGLVGTNSANIVVSPAPASQLTIQTQPSTTATAGVAFAQQPVVRVEDAFGNLRSADNSTLVTAEINEGSADLSGGVTVAAKNGVATFTNLVYPIAETISIDFTNAALDRDTSISIVVNPAIQSITFGSLAGKIYGDADFAVNATASSGLPVNFNIVSGPATIFGNVISLTGAGTVIVRASQPGDATFAAATSVNQSFAVAKTNSAIIVATSASPSPTTSNVTFTATVTALPSTPTGSVQFVADGSTLGSPAALTGGVASITTAALSHGSHVITARYAGDANFFGSTNNLAPNQIINASPVVTNDALSRHKNSGAKVRLETLLANDTDPEGDALTFVSADATSVNGGLITVEGRWLAYAPPVGSTNADSFSYVITDAGGLTDSGTVTIAVTADDEPCRNSGSIVDLGNGSVRIYFDGIPDRAYAVQYTENLQTPDWQPLGTVTADAFGKFNFTDTPPVNAAARSYRATQP